MFMGTVFLVRAGLDGPDVLLRVPRAAGSEEFQSNFRSC